MENTFCITFVPSGRERARHQSHMLFSCLDCAMHSTPPALLVSLSLFIYNPTRSLVVTANSVALILFVSLSLVRSLRCAAIVILCLIARGALSFSLLIFAQGQLEVFKFIYVCAHVYTYKLMCVHIHACVCASYLFVHGTIKLFVGLAFASLSFWFFFFHFLLMFGSCCFHCISTRRFEAVGGVGVT